MTANSIATLGPLGYLPAAGTVATLVTLMLVVVLQALLGSSVGYCVGVALFCCGSALAIVYALPYYTHAADPQEIILDEVIGTLVTFMFTPLSWDGLALGFVLFRFFDIFKPWPISFFEKLPGTWGIMFDDIAAGMVSAGILHSILWYKA